MALGNHIKSSARQQAGLHDWAPSRHRSWLTLHLCHLWCLKSEAGEKGGGQSHWLSTLYHLKVLDGSSMASTQRGKADRPLACMWGTQDRTDRLQVQEKGGWLNVSCQDTWWVATCGGKEISTFCRTETHTHGITIQSWS
jgi:hypothetical protein